MINIACVVYALKDLHQLNEDSRLTSGMKDRIQILKQELQLLVLYMFCLTKWDDSSFGKNDGDSRLTSVAMYWIQILKQVRQLQVCSRFCIPIWNDSGFAEISRVEATLEKKGLLETGLLALDTGEFKDWNTLSSELLENIQRCKQKIKENFLDFLDSLFRCEFSSGDLQELMSYTAVSLANLLLIKGDMIRDEKLKIESLKEKLDLFKEVFQFTTNRCNSHDEMENFKIHIQAWAFNAACLCLLNCVLGESEESMASKMNIILTRLQQKIITSSPEVTRMCLAVLKASKPSAEDGFEVGQLASKFVEFLLGNLQVNLPKDGIRMLCSDLIFLTKFLMDPPEAKKYTNNGLQEVFLNFLDCLHRCEFSSDELQELMSYTAVSLANLLLLKGDTICDEKLKIESLKEKLDLFKDVFQFTTKRCNSHEEMENFKIHIQDWACDAACLCLLNWFLDEKEENMGPQMNIVLLDLQQKIITCTPEITRMCLAVLRASKPSAEVGFEVGQLVSKLVEFLLGNFQVDLPKDGIRMLFSVLRFLTTFLMDPPEAKKYANDGLQEDFRNFLDCLSQCEFSRDELQELMSYTAVSLANLLLLKGDMIHDEELKIESLKEKLDLFKDVFQFTTKRCNSHEEMENFKILIQDWACNAACLCLLNWFLDEKEENMAPRMNIMLSDFQQKIITSTPEVTRMCLAVLKVSKLSAEDDFEIGPLVSKFVEFLLGNLQADLLKDGIQMLCSVLIFQPTFLMDPPATKKYANDGLLEGFVNFLDCLSQCEFSRDKLKELMSYTAFSLANLLLLKGDMIRGEKVKIESLKEKLDLFKDVFQFTSKWCNSHEEMENFKIHIQAWAFNAACLCLLNWLLDEKKENQAPKLNIILSELQQKIITSTPEVTRMCIAVLMALKPSAEVGSEVGQLVSKLVEFLLGNFQVDLPKDGIQMLFSVLIFLTTFLKDPPEATKYANDGLQEGFLNFLDCLHRCEFSSDELQELMSYTAVSLANLLLLKGDAICDEKLKIESLKEKLDLFKDVFQFTTKRCNSHEEMENFKIHIQDWACDAACLCLLNWFLDEKEENMAPQMNIVLLDLQQKIITSTPEVTRMCIAVLMALKPSAEVGSEVGQLVSKLVEFLLGNFQVDLPKDGIQMLFSVLIFLTTFLKDPPEAKKYANDGLQEGFLNFLDCLSQCEFSRDELQELMSYTAISLANLLLLKGDMIDDEKLKIESLKKKLDLFKDVFQFTSKWCNSHEEMENFKIHIQAWAFNAACLCLLNWLLDEKKENQAPKLNIILSELQQKIITSTPEVTRMCLAVLKVSKPSAKDGFEVGELVSKFVHFLLRNLQVDLPKDGIQMLCSGLIFLITFLMDPPEPQKYSDYKGTFFNGSAFSAFAYQRQAAAAAVSEAASLFSSLNATEIKESISEGRNSLLHDFLTKVNGIKAEVRKLHSYLSLDGSSFNWPRINVIGLLDSLIENLEEKSINFSKHQIVTVQEELVSLRNLLKASNLKECFMSDLQNKNKYLKDLWAEIINVVYQAEMTISSFMLMKNSVWLDMLCLFDITEEIKHIEGKVKRFQDQHMHEIDALNTELSSSPVVSMDEVVVGFKNEEKDILDHLTSGTKELEIILIIGMAGMGKTTLAKKVYGNPSIQYHFTKCAWCVVSQSYNSKKLLLDILTTVTGVSDSFIEMEEEELAQMLQRSLKGQRYLIVMDDIWDVSAWNALELSFPDDNNGSRIMFTSQIHNVALEAKPNSFPYHLSPLSEEESWELLEKRLFQGDTCPPNFVEVGRCIAKNCKGLPLAVVLVAGLLKKEIENLDWWKQIGENLVSWISREGCDEILKLSYKHLSEPLKSCFLYFGSFPEDKVIRVQRLTQLWVSEGFIPKQEMKTSEIVAKEYLMDLVNRSLVIVTDRSSMGEIKACRIHDLLWKFCLRKGEEENFLKVVHGNDVSQFSKDKHYRVLIQTKHWESFLNSSPPTLHSLLFSPTGTSAASTESFYFSKFKFLRVLNLEGLKFLGDFPEEVTTLVLLRYFSIWWNTSNTTIPRSITRLANLETLRIRRTGFATEFALHLPLDILSMKNLKHVHVGNCITPLNGNVPPLESIQSFSCAHLPAGKAESILRQIPKVRKLKCTFIESGTGIPKLDFLNHLESLKVTYGSCSFPQSLKKLTLRCFLKPWTEISIIANLPNLEVLKLRRNAFIGKTWNMEDEKFSKLKFLKLESAYIEEWNASPESFPCLECLIVEHCFELEEIPSEFAEIPTLGMIQVRWCKPTVARSAKQIREEQIELGNEDFKVLIY